MTTKSLDVSGQAGRKRGRPKGSGTIPDARLEGWRNNFVWALENYWGAVGYELLQAITTAQIRAAFAALPEPPRTDFFRLYCHSYSIVAETKQQRRDRIHHGELIDQQRAACEVEEKRRTSLNVALSALRAAEGTDQQQAIEDERDLRAQALAQAEQRRIQLDEQQRTLATRIADQAAGFAQTELLRFILEQRYKLTPLKFANAMAGAPFMGYRQSVKRCLPLRCPIANSVVYREFKIISAAIASDMKAGSLSERVRLYLQRKKVDKESKRPIAELKRKWYYLAKAIDHMASQEHPVDALPFRVMAEYQRLFNAHTPVDEILADEAQLS